MNVKIINIALLLLSLNTLVGCSALSSLSMLAGGGTPTLGIEATLGDKEEAVVGQLGSSQEIAVESVTGGITTNNTQDIPMEYMLLMILGWVLPSPMEIVKNTGSFIKSLFGRKNHA